MRLSRIGIKWYETGSRFGINILNLIPGRPIKWKVMHTMDVLIIRKKQLISKQVINSKGNNRKLYKLTAHLAGINTDNPLPPHDSNESLANHFTDYFISKIDKIHENFIGIPAFAPEVTDVPIFKKFAPLTPSQVPKLVVDMQTKSCELDPIPTHVFKQMLPVLISIITHIFNTSLNNACF